MTKRFKKKISTQEYADLILEKVKEVLDSERFKAFLLSPDMLQAFRQEVLGLEPYSFNNRMTLGLMGATTVAGFKTWRSLGFFVKKGSKGFPIYRPLLIKADEREEKEGIQGTNEDKGGKQLIGFDVAYVFDISQVSKRQDDGNEDKRKQVEEFFQKQERRNCFCLELVGGSSRMLKKVQSWVETQFPVTLEVIHGGTKGITNGKEIKINLGMSPSQTTKTLLHELAHCRLGHTVSELSKSAREIQAESAAFVAASRLGLDTGPYSFDYLAAWGNEILQEDKGVREFRQILQIALEEGNEMASEFEIYLRHFAPLPVPEEGRQVASTVG